MHMYVYICAYYYNNKLSTVCTCLPCSLDHQLNPDPTNPDPCIQELEQQRKVLSDDKKSQEAIARQLGEDLQSINDKKRLAEDDVERLTTSNHQLQQQMATLNGSYLALQGQLGQVQTEYQERVQRLENELGMSQQHRVRGEGKGGECGGCFVDVLT